MKQLYVLEAAGEMGFAVSTTEQGAKRKAKALGLYTGDGVRVRPATDDDLQWAKENDVIIPEYRNEHQNNHTDTTRQEG